jgi:hypothetical protein
MSDSSVANTMELFAKEQLDRLISTMKNQAVVEENMNKLYYLPKLIEWTAGSYAKDKFLQGGYRSRVVYHTLSTSTTTSSTK